MHLRYYHHTGFFTFCINYSLIFKYIAYVEKHVYISYDTILLSVCPVFLFRLLISFIKPQPQ